MEPAEEWSQEARLNQRGGDMKPGRGGGARELSRINKDKGARTLGGTSGD